jgi:hypothetical protein
MKKLFIIANIIALLIAISLVLFAYPYKPWMTMQRHVEITAWGYFCWLVCGNAFILMIYGLMNMDMESSM